MARATALAYHAVTDRWPHALAVSTRDFRVQLERLANRGLRGVTLSELATGDVDRAIAITFDDGFASVATEAKSILDSVGWPATVFVVTDAVGTGAPMRWLGGPPGHWDAERVPLTWAQVGELAASGWEIGSHTRTHRLLSALSDEELAAELHESRVATAAHAGACTSISYPYGELDARVATAARAAGYTCGSGLAGRFEVGDPMRIPRVAIAAGDEPARFAVKTSSPFGTFRRSLLWTMLDGVRRPGRPFGDRIVAG